MDITAYRLLPPPLKLWRTSGGLRFTRNVSCIR